MGWSQIDDVFVQGGTLTALGDINAPKDRAPLNQSLRFLLVQGDQAVAADAADWGARWIISVEAPGVRAGEPALATAVITRVYKKPNLPVITEVSTWSETWIVGSGPMADEAVSEAEARS
jgi:hypothetical protein